MASRKLSGSLPRKKPSKPTGIVGVKRGERRTGKVKPSGTNRNPLSSKRRGKLKS